MTTAKIIEHGPGDIVFDAPFDALVRQAKIVARFRPRIVADFDDIQEKFLDRVRFAIAAKAYIAGIARDVCDYSTRIAIANAAAAEFARRGVA
jgi:hypothetical protein